MARRGELHPPWRCPGDGRQHLPICLQPPPEPRAAQPQERAVFHAFCPHPPPPAMLDAVEAPLAVRFHHQVSTARLALMVSRSTASTLPPAAGPPRDSAGNPARRWLCRSRVTASWPSLSSTAGIPNGRRWPSPVGMSGLSDECGPVALPLASLPEVATVRVEMARIVLRTDTVHPIGCRLADVPPALLEKRLIEPLLEVAEPDVWGAPGPSSLCPARRLTWLPRPALSGPGRLCRLRLPVSPFPM